MTADRRQVLKAAAALASASIIDASGSWAAESPGKGTAVRLDAKPLPDSAGSLPGAAEPLSLDGSAAGPVLRVRRGESLDVALANGLKDPLALQWQGLRGSDAFDGAPGLTGPAVAPGANTSLRIAPPDAGLAWLHPAAVPGQPDLTSRGLRGVLIVDEPEPPAVDRDQLAMVADWVGLGGKPGPVTVNGKVAPERATIVSGGRLRLRVVNASVRRIMLFTLEGGRPQVVAVDGQPSDLFAPVRDTVPAGPGARFELLIDMPREPGKTLRLTLRGTQRTGGVVEPERVLLEITTEGAARPPLPPIAALPRNPRLPTKIGLEKSVRAELTATRVPGAVAAGQPRWTVNGTATLALSDKPLFAVSQGGAVTLGLNNASTEPVAIRVHGQAMRLLHPKDDSWAPYWRESVLLPPRSVNRVAFVADAPGKWLIESCFFDQATSGLRDWFLVR